MAEQPRPHYSSKHVLSDLDATLLDRRYQFTSLTIGRTVSDVQKNGLVIGLSSDTPYRALEAWHGRMGMNGPIIAEKGAVLGLGTGLIYDSHLSSAFAETREKIERDLTDKRFVLWHGNPVEAVRAGAHIGSPGDEVGLVNDLRIASAKVFFRRVDSHGRLVVDNETTRRAVDGIEEFYPDFPVTVDYNESYGLIIISKAGIDKRSGTIDLMRLQSTERIHMIGDSDADIVGTDIADHYAVANATSGLKEIAVYTANKPITEGAEEILIRIGNRV